MNTPKQNKMVRHVTHSFEELRVIVADVFEHFNGESDMVDVAIDVAESQLKQALLDEEDLR